MSLLAASSKDAFNYLWKLHPGTYCPAFQDVGGDGRSSSQLSESLWNAMKDVRFLPLPRAYSEILFLLSRWFTSRYTEMQKISKNEGNVCYILTYCQYTITCPFHLIPAYEVLIIVFADNYCSINNNVNVLMCMMFSLLPSLCACRSRTSPESSCILAENDGASAEVFCEIVRLKYGCGRLCR